MKKKITIVVCTYDQYTEKQGVHLNSPDTWYLNDAIVDINRKGFDTIYCHYEPDGLLYKLSQDMLHMLVTLGKKNTISFLHPASSNKFEHTLTA